MRKQRFIGVAMDFSKGSKSALKWAIDNMLRKGDTLYVIHVIPIDAHGVEWSSFRLEESDEQRQMRAYGINLDQEVLDILGPARKKQVNVEVVMSWGDAREKLCVIVNGGHLKIDALVMGCRGLGSSQRLIGSVTNYVMQNAECPVTVVKDPTGHHGLTSNTDISVAKQ